MKKLYILILCALVSGYAIAQQPPISFEFWNRTNEPVYVEIGSADNLPTGKNLVPLNARGATTTNVSNKAIGRGNTVYDVRVRGDYLQIPLDTIKKTYILLSRKETLEPHDQAALITINASKNILLELTPDFNGVQLFPDDSKKYTVTPQASLMGKLLGVTEHNLPLMYNVTSSDITIDPNFYISEKIITQPKAAVNLKARASMNALDGILSNFKDDGTYVGSAKFTKAEAAAYRKALQDLKDAEYDLAWIETYEQKAQLIEQAAQDEIEALRATVIKITKEVAETEIEAEPEIAEMAEDPQENQPEIEIESVDSDE